MKIVSAEGWVLEGTPDVVGLNVNMGKGPAPAVYLSLRGVEVFVTQDELREIWDHWTDFTLPRPEKSDG